MKGVVSKIYVKNLHNGSTPPPDGYNSWIRYWLENQCKYREIPICPQCKQRKAEDGSHVKKVGGEDNHWYIVPLCESCNERKDDKPFEVNEDMLVPANPQNL